MPPANSFVLDTSALLALRSDESAADRVEAASFTGEKETMPAVRFFHEQDGGPVYRMARRRRRCSSPALRLMDSFAVEWISCEPNILEIASRIKAHGGLSVAGSRIGATAIAYDATLVHKDPEFEPLKEIMQEVLK